MAGGEEETWLGGAVTAAVRVGSTVRRPVGQGTEAVNALLVHLERAGFAGAPRYLGVDDKGRTMLSWIEGRVPDREDLERFGDDGLESVGALLRRFHDAVAGSDSGTLRFEEGPSHAGRGEIVCHGDIAPRNTVFVDGVAAAFIDWDGAWFADPLWDVAHAVWQFAPMRSIGRLRAEGWRASPNRAERGGRVVDGYALDRSRRERLAEMIVEVIGSCRRGVLEKARAGKPAFLRLVNDGVLDELDDDTKIADDEADRLTAALMRTALQ